MRSIWDKFKNKQKRGWSAEAKPIVGKPKAITEPTSYLIEMVNFGTIVLTLLMTDHVKGHKWNEEKTEIYMCH
jgi:hypothetical protein